MGEGARTAADTLIRATTTFAYDELERLTAVLSDERSGFVLMDPPLDPKGIVANTLGGDARFKVWHLQWADQPIVTVIGYNKD